MGSDVMNDKNTNYIDVEVNIKYTNEEFLEISEVIRALESAEKIILRTKPFIEKASVGYRIDDIQVFVEEAQSGSFFEKLKTRIIFGSEEKEANAAKAAADFIDNTRMDNLIPLAIGAILGAGAIYAVQSSSNTLPSNHIEAYNSNIINFGDNTTLTTDDVKELLDNSPNKPQMAREATAFISPAKKGKTAEIEIGSSTKKQLVVVNSDVVGQTPEKYEKPEPSEKSESYNDVTISVIALDRQNPSNWHGEIADVVEQRTKIVFAEDIDISKLFKEKIKANVEVTSKYIKSKKTYQAHEIYVSKILD